VRISIRHHRRRRSTGFERNGRISLASSPAQHERATAVFARIAICDEIDVANMGPVVAWFQAHSDELNDQLPGYLGSQTLLDPASRRMIGIGLYDSEAHAQAVDAFVDQGPPPEMPPAERLGLGRRRA
jgi:hypothetical protein